MQFYISNYFSVMNFYQILLLSSKLTNFMNNLNGYLIHSGKRRLMLIINLVISIKDSLLFIRFYKKMIQADQSLKYNEYKQRYNSNCLSWRSEPVSDRKLNNPICLGIFISLTIFFIAVGVYYISTRPLNLNFDVTINFEQQKAPLLVCTFLSIFVSLIYIFLIRFFPRGMVYTMIFITLGLLAILCIMGIIKQNYPLALTMGISLLIYSCILGCFRERIKTGIVLVKVATTFMTGKPLVFLTPIIKIIMTVLFAVFWLYTIILIFIKADQQRKNQQDTSVSNIFIGVWVLLWLFYTFFFYYLMVFTVAVTCSFWYYRVEGKNPIATAYKWIIKSAMGSLTFAALVITFITLARILIDQRKKKTSNIAGAVCLCILSCFFRQIQALLQILNHNSIICMAVTGEDFINSARTTIGIICQQFPLFSVTRLISNFLVFWGTLISVGIPCIVSYIWVGANYQSKNSPFSVFLVTFLIALSSMMVSGIIYSILVESISSVFIFYCFDRRFQELGYSCHNMPPEIYRDLGGIQQQTNQSNQSYQKLYE